MADVGWHDNVNSKNKKKRKKKKHSKTVKSESPNKRQKREAEVVTVDEDTECGRRESVSRGSDDQRSNHRGKDASEEHRWRDRFGDNRRAGESERFRDRSSHQRDRHENDNSHHRSMADSQSYSRSVFQDSNFQQDFSSHSHIISYPPMISRGNSYVGNHLFPHRDTNHFYDTETLPLHGNLENDFRCLQRENERLKMALTNVISEPGDMRPEVQVIFKHEGLAKRFRSKIENFITDLFKQDGQAIEDIFSEKPLFRTNDTSAAEDYSNSNVPLYDVDVSVSVDQGNESDARNKESFRSVCFNCSGNHFMYECPEVLCPQRIAENKAERFATSALQNMRYHENENVQENFKPGIISDDLRNAMSLEKDQVPLYIYRMRMFGYPPGWLEEAMVKSSGLAMYGVEDNSPKESQNDNQTTGSRIQYDCEKLIDYPGFNVPLPPDFVDESEMLGMPPFQQSQMRSFMESSVEKSIVRPKRKRKIEDKPPEISAIINSDAEDMEVVDECEDLVSDDMEQLKDDFVPPLPPMEKCASPLPPLPPSPLPPPPDMLPPLPSAEDMIESLEDGSISLHSSANISRETSAPIVITSDSENTKLSGKNSLSSSDNVLLLSSKSSEPTESNFSPLCPASPDNIDELAELELKIQLRTVVEQQLVDGLDAAEQPYSNSPSLDELEEKKRLIMLALTDVDDDDIKNSLSPGQPKLHSKETCPVPNDESSQIQASVSSSQKSLEPASILGSPVIPAFTSFRRLPNIEKFGQGIQEHLPYENMPNSTGTYEQMKIVLRGVKEKMAQLKE